MDALTMEAIKKEEHGLVVGVLAIKAKEEEEGLAVGAMEAREQEG